MNRTQLAEDRREQILNAAARVISSRGADSARLIDVSRGAGVSVGLIQHYFGTRERLLAETFDHFNERFIRDWGTGADAGNDPPARLFALLSRSSFEDEEWRGSAWALWVEFYSLANRNTAFSEQHATIYTRWRQPFLEAIADGLETGVFSSSDSALEITDRITALIEGLRSRSILEPLQMPPERIFRLLLDAATIELSFPLSDYADSVTTVRNEDATHADGRFDVVV